MPNIFLRISRLSCPRFHRPTSIPNSYARSRMHSTIRELVLGNLQYMARISDESPSLLRTLANEGQRPPFMLIDCSDSRVNEQEIFSAKPGTLFTSANIANRFDETDPNSNAALSFAVESLKVKHVIILGHYGCGGVAAAMMPYDAEAVGVAVQNWISPIRDIYRTSPRKEIALHREKYKLEPSASVLPDLHDPAFRALVEENVKSNVQKIANSRVVYHRHKVALEAHASGAHEPTAGISIHGWVYDLESGSVSDLGVSTRHGVTSESV